MTLFRPQAGGGGLSRADHLNVKIELDGNSDATTGSFTPQSNSLLVVCITHTHNTGVAHTMALSGGGWTFTERVTASSGGPTYFGRTSIFTAPVGTAAAMTLTVNGSSSGDDGAATFQVMSFTGYNTGSPTGATAIDTTLASSGENPMTLSGAPAASSVVVACRRFEASEAEDAQATADTSGGWTEVYDAPALGGFAGYAGLQTQVRTGSTSDDVRWDEVNALGTALSDGVALALEIVAA